MVPPVRQIKILNYNNIFSTLEHELVAKLNIYKSNIIHNLIPRYLKWQWLRWFFLKIRFH